MKKLLSLALSLAMVVTLAAAVGTGAQAARALPAGVLYYWGFENDADVSAVEQMERQIGPENSSDYEIIPSTHTVTIAQNRGAVGNALFLDGTYGVRLDGLEPLEEDCYTISFWMCADPIAEYAPTVVFGSNMAGHPFYRVGWMNFMLAPENFENTSYDPIVWMHAAPDPDLPGDYVTMHAEKPEAYRAGEWKMMTLVVDGEHFVGTDGYEHVGTKLYIDGKLALDATAATKSEVAVMPGLLSFDSLEGLIGINYTDDCFTGYVDELYIFDHALDAEAVAGLYSTGNPPKAPKPAAAPKAQLKAIPSDGYYDYVDEFVQLVAAPGDTIYYELYDDVGEKHIGTVMSGESVFVPAIPNCRYVARLYAYVMGDQGNAVSCEYTMDSLPSNPQPSAPGFNGGRFYNNNDVEIYLTPCGGSFDADVTIIRTVSFMGTGSNHDGVVDLSLTDPAGGYVGAVFYVDSGILNIFASNWPDAPAGTVFYGLR